MEEENHFYSSQLSVFIHFSEGGQTSLISTDKKIKRTPEEEERVLLCQSQHM